MARIGHVGDQSLEQGVAAMRRIFSMILALAVVMTAIGPGFVSAAGLEAGVAAVDITPPAKYRMSGYFYERLNTGTHDPLMAKAIVFRQGLQQSALVFCDLIGMPLELTTRVRQLAEQKTGIPQAHILIAATHSHTGPLYFGAMHNRLHNEAVAKHGNDPCETIDYPAQLAEKLVAVIGQAQAACRPVTLEAGVTKQEGLSFNRRFHMKDGTVRFNPGKLNPAIVRPAGPIDPGVGLLLLRDTERRPLASLTVFALHLDTVGGTEYSADYPYYLQRSLQQELGDKFLSLFGNGTCGDINHFDVSTKRSQGGHDEAKRIGETLAGTVKAKLGGLTEVKGPALATRQEILQIPLQRPSAEEIAWASEAFKKVGSNELPFLEQVKACRIMAIHGWQKDTRPMPVQVFRLGEDLAIVALPGEVFVDLGLAIKQASPFATTLVVELAHDSWCAYVPTRKAFDEGSYEVVNSRVQPGGGEILVDTAVRLLKELKQELR
jgi:hypothetical protein